MFANNSFGNTFHFHFSSPDQPGRNQAHEQVQPQNLTTSSRVNENQNSGHVHNTGTEVNDHSGLERNDTTVSRTFSFRRPIEITENITNNSASATASTNLDNDVYQLHAVSPCKPKYMEYADLTKRVFSFRHWPTEISQRPEDLAQAGFFSIGNGDLVRCFYCGIGFKHWEPDDDVWKEHARWSPQCMHLINCKGRNFVDFIQTIADDSNEENHEIGQSVQGSQHLYASERDLEAELRTLEDTSSPLLTTIAAESVILFGYDKDTVLKAINIYKFKEGSVDFRAEDLLRILFELEDGSIDYDEIVSNRIVYTEEEPDTELKTLDDQLQYVLNGALNKQQTESLDLSKLLEENKELKEEKLCKVCLETQMSVVFLPCGHLVCCYKCAPALKKCPICQSVIKGNVKALLT